LDADLVITQNLGMKIAYCIPSLYKAGEMERLLTVKANYFAEALNFDIYIILTDGRGKPPFLPLSSKITVINLDINFDDLEVRSFMRRAVLYRRKAFRYKKRLKESLSFLRPDITVSMVKKGNAFLPSISDGRRKIGEHHWEIPKTLGNGENDKDALENMVSKYWM
jgi:hypothetical protein